MNNKIAAIRINIFKNSFLLSQCAYFKTFKGISRGYKSFIFQILNIAAEVILNTKVNIFAILYLRSSVYLIRRFRRWWDDITIFCSSCYISFCIVFIVSPAMAFGINFLLHCSSQFFISFYCFLSLLSLSCSSLNPLHCTQQNNVIQINLFHVTTLHQATFYN